MLLGISIASLLYWIALWVAVARTRAGVSLLAPLSERASWPRVSMIVPARNEAAHIERALRSKLDDAYPELEVVFVNDRSADETGRIAEELARQDPRLRVVHVTELPHGWLGKVHAMQRGLEQATGEWILFSDADVSLAPGTLQRAVGQAEREAADHVSILPRMICPGPLLQAAIASFWRVIAAGGRLWRVADPESSAAAGIGAFNLVRAAALARTPGLEWLRMEIADDMGLAVMLKRSGARPRVFNGRDCVSLQFYPSYGALVRAVEKNGVAAPFPVLVLTNLLMVVLEGGFFAGPAIVALPAWAIAIHASYRLSRWLGLPVWPSVVPALGVALFAAAMIRSGALAAARGGVLWRGTLYPTREVRAGARVGFVPSGRKQKTSSRERA